MGYSFIFKKGVGWLSQAFRSDPGSPYNPPGGHTGMDWAVPAGTPVYSPCDGYIRNSGWLTDNYMANPWWLTAMGGDTLVIDGVDANGRTETMPTFIIAHLQDSTAPVGKRVRKGELIGLSGNSGTATTGPHAHIEVLPPNWDWNNGVYGRVNPMDYFTEWPGEITAQSTPAKPESKEPFTVAQYEEIIQQLSAIKNQVNNTWSGVWAGGTYKDKKYNYGILPIVVENQRRIALQDAQIKALVGAIAALSKGEPFDEAKLLAGVQAAAEAGVKSGIENGVIDVNVTVAGGTQ